MSHCTVPGPLDLDSLDEATCSQAAGGEGDLHLPAAAAGAKGEMLLRAGHLALRDQRDGRHWLPCHLPDRISQSQDRTGAHSTVD